MDDELRNKREEMLKREIQALMMDYSAPGVTNERRVQIENTLRYKQEKLAELSQIAEKRLENPIQRQKDWRANLYKLDCRKARKEIEKVKKLLSAQSGAASFFIQNSDDMEGEHCVAHIEEVFEFRSSKEIRSLRRAFSAETGLSPSRMLTEFKRELGIEETHEHLHDGLCSVVKRLSEQLNHGMLIFVEVRFGHIAEHDQQGLDWLLTEFWPALLEAVVGKGSGIHCLLVIVCGKKLKSLPTTMACRPHLHEKAVLREIKPEPWKKTDVEEWLLSYAKLPVNLTPQNIAERVWQERRPPAVIALTLLRELNLIFNPKPKED
ncbi:MAG TPA: hypothetical protein PLD20_30585 [Blastocatellia bacterium]|nr:hypothetical protein [Blastocatellia bacterium]HMV83608.1 hypothetical protein [Blastocatellia bacterium]HMX26568.1 hypothetical protein [Blastocatellia bacterium]HMY73515.1 hypothetical protein [Blastocatellia bacterium]HMZ22318.1 hypothetical protein [Blastocatellia bacterium]